MQVPLPLRCSLGVDRQLCPPKFHDFFQFQLNFYFPMNSVQFLKLTNRDIIDERPPIAGVFAVTLIFLARSHKFIVKPSLRAQASSNSKFSRSTEIIFSLHNWFLLSRVSGSIESSENSSKAFRGRDKGTSSGLRNRFSSSPIWKEMGKEKHKSIRHSSVENDYRRGAIAGRKFRA